MRCPNCGQEWQTNYCPSCKKTIQETSAESEYESQAMETAEDNEQGLIESDTNLPDKSSLEQDLKFCTHCGQKLDVSVNFCWNCGTQLTATVAPVQLSEKPGSKGTLSMASAALTVSLVGFVLYCCCIGVLFEPIALYLGIRALAVLNNDPGYSGRGLAIAGIVISGLLILFAFILFIFALTSDINYYESFYTP